MESIYLKVTRDYTPNGNEARYGGKDSAISVEKGDIIFDVKKDGDGWLCGKNLNTGKSGRFPSDCVSKLSNEKENSSPKTTDKKDTLSTKPQNLSRGSTADTKSSSESTGNLRRPPNPRPFGLSSRYPRSQDREKKESSGDSGVVADGEDYYLNDDTPEKKKPPDSKSPPIESESKKPSVYESRFGNKTYSPIYSSRPSVSKLKSTFLDNDLKTASKVPDMKGKDKPNDNIELNKKPLSSELTEKKSKTGKPALASKEDDDDNVYASAEIDQKASDVNKNKKPNTSKEEKDKKINIQENPLLKADRPPYHSYQVPQGPDKPPRTGGCSECDEPHIYADPGAEHYIEPNTPENSSVKYDFDPTENRNKKQEENGADSSKTESNRRSYNRMASYESISNVGPEKSASKVRSTESFKGAMKAVKNTAKKKLVSTDKYPKIRIIAGSLLGIFFGVFIFLLFFVIIPLHAITAIVAGIVVGIVFAVIFGFLDRKRFLCILLLIFPSLFASRGKIALWILITYFLIAGPLCNFIGNVNIIASTRGKCYVMTSTGGGNDTDNRSAEAHPTYSRFDRPLQPVLQHYIDTVEKLKEFTNKTLSPVHNKTTLKLLCADFSTRLRNICMFTAKGEYQDCMRDAKDPSILSRCQTLKPDKLCDSHIDIESKCNNIDLSLQSRFKDLVRSILDTTPAKGAALVTTKDEKGPILVTPERNKCDNGVDVLTMLLPLLILLVLYEAYIYHKLYLARNDFDNQYLTNHFKTIEDTRKSSGANDGLLPLKKCEHQRYIQPTSPQFTISERRNLLKYLLVYFVFLAFAMIIILGDYYLYYAMTRTIHTQETTLTSSSNTTNTTSHDNTGAATVASCALLVVPLGEYYLVVILVLLGILLVLIVIQPYVLRLRHFIASNLYRRRERKRIAFVYYKLLEERKAFYKAVIDNINMESEENYAMDQLDVVRVLAWNFTTMEKMFSVLGVSLRNCMVCGRGLNRQYIYCDTDTCESIYCRTCFWDLGNKCLGCMQDSNPLSRTSSFIQGSSRKRKVDNTQGV